MTRSKKQPRWQQEQKGKKNREKRFQVLMGVLFLGLVGLLILVSFLWQKAKDSIWDGRSRLGIVRINDQDLEVLVGIPDQERLVKLVVPGNTLVKVPFGFGEYQVIKVFDLGELEGQGGKLVTATVQDMLGVAVKGYKKGSQTNLSWWDQGRWWWQRQTRFKKMSKLELSQEGVLDEEVLADQVKVYRPNLVLVDELMNQEIFDEKVVQENLSIAVLNASGVEGVASKVSRLINNLGGEVRFVSNAAAEEASVIMIEQESLEATETVKQLSQALGIETVKVGGGEEYRAEVVLVIGQDYTSLK